MIRRWFPHPVLSVLLLLIWLLLKQSLAPGTILLGALLGIALARMYDLLRPPKARAHDFHLLGVLFVRVTIDIFRSNLAVARIILARNRSLNSGFVAIPLDLTDRHGLAVLACIITSTPGTIWVSYDSSANILLIHVLDLADEQVWIDTIKRRYERLLLGIFQ
ncbi:MAG: Na+/H+ antiporter subunit E [Xanthomonadales bacterium]|jgi:multicomponent K+:H+ antiporter subunit E|uniref:Na+/H+ antiporter subunit E n=1 Tax=Dokdonella sp. TaxID=2291710 RepID=UPI002BF3623B|nr:Na+/H+ antiporter subunit E [Xanthomonadales bacterium]HQW75890.1 Na+/H+ antiporter subunit E [Dokdonella sp.]MBK7012013.1 Na+/H+ antiporter subunit E [Xanthomonadales bacterium]MBK7209917.1 Na+/H+ antiporter subunit E [Xanthomonadales bacterium]MBL0222574.1 Na+/H+ antiporter subunit E [Xanthomonadales bacterium]